MNAYQPKTGQPCHCKRGQQRDNCPDCEGTGQRIDFAAIRARRGIQPDPQAAALVSAAAEATEHFNDDELEQGLPR